MLKNALPKVILGLLIAALVPASAEAAGKPRTLALEGAQPSFSSAFSGESPPETGFSHQGRIEDDGPLFGVSFEIRPIRVMGIRLGFLTGSNALRTDSNCSPCEFSGPGRRVNIVSEDWPVREKSTLEAVFVELPFVARPSPKVEIFAGPTVAFVDVAGGTSAGPEGLILGVEIPSPSYGLHLGGTVDLGWKRKWVAGFLARFVRTQIDFNVTLASVPFSRGNFTSDRDLGTLGLVIGRRFGGSNG